MKSYMIDQYQILGECIDSRGIIQKAKTGNGEEICVKIIKKSHQKTEQQMRLEREIDICRKLKTIVHENIIKFYDIIEKDDTIYFFMECCPITLNEYIDKKQFTYQNYLELIYQISSGYKKLIELDIIHRDIKLENIVLKEDQSGKLTFKIIDFGISKFLGSVGQGQISRAETKCIGTEVYMAPEILNFEEENYDNSCDIYSLGIIIVIIMCGKNTIINSKWVKNIRQKIQQKSIKEFIQIKESIPSQIADIVDSMVTARKWRISWKQLNKRVDQLRCQIIEVKNEIIQTPKKTPNTFHSQDNILTGKKFNPPLQSHPILQNNWSQNQYCDIPPKPSQINNNQINNQSNQVPQKQPNINPPINNKIRYDGIPQGQFSFHENKIQNMELGPNTARTPEINKQPITHCNTEVEQPNLLKRAQNNQQVQQLINHQINQEDFPKQNNNQNFQIPGKISNNQNHQQGCQRLNENTTNQINPQNKFKMNKFYFCPQKYAQQFKNQQTIKPNQSLTDLQQKEVRISHQHQQTYAQYQGKNLQFKTMNHK